MRSPPSVRNPGATLDRGPGAGAAGGAVGCDFPPGAVAGTGGDGRPRLSLRQAMPPVPTMPSTAPRSAPRACPGLPLQRQVRGLVEGQQDPAALGQQDEPG